MSPTQASPADDRDFPRLNGRNFMIWKTRVTAALEGKNLLGFVTNTDFTGDSDSEFSDDDYLDPAYFNENPAVTSTLDEIGAPSADIATNSSSNESSGSSSAVSDADGDVDMTQENLPAVKSFNATKHEERKRAEKLKAKRPKLSSRQLRHMEAKAKAFLIKTIDDQHVLMVKDKTTAFEIFKTLCGMYEDAAIHGDPYYILNYLMTLRYDEGSDLNRHMFEVEDAMKNASTTTNSVMTDEQKTIYLYHTLPDHWQTEMKAWNRSRKYIPYEELKRHIETKVRTEMARNRYILKQGTPESRATQAETALQVMISGLEKTTTKTEEALVSTRKCSYCDRDNHDTVDCYILQRHLQNGQVKEGTVLPPNFKLKSVQSTQRPHPFRSDFKNKRGKPTRNNYNNRGDNNRKFDDRRQEHGHQDHQGRNNSNKFHGRRNQLNNNSDNSDYGIIVITTLDLAPSANEISLTAQDMPHDPMWTIDSGYTRHVTSSSIWFQKMKRTIGKSITVGGNHQIPILGTGDVSLMIKDTKGKERIITHQVRGQDWRRHSPLSVPSSSDGH